MPSPEEQPPYQIVKSSKSHLHLCKISVLRPINKFGDENIHFHHIMQQNLTCRSTGELTRHKLGGNESQMGSKKWYLMTHKNEEFELHLSAQQEQCFFQCCSLAPLLLAQISTFGLFTPVPPSLSFFKENNLYHIHTEFQQPCVAYIFKNFKPHEIALFFFQLQILLQKSL